MFSTFSSNEPKLYKKIDKIRLYVIGDSVSNIQSEGSFLSASILDCENEKTVFKFSELIKAYNQPKKLLVFRDYSSANVHLNEVILTQGKRELRKGLAASDMIEIPKVNKIAVPLFELLVPTQLVEKIFSQNKGESVFQEIDRAILNCSPICAIIKDQVIYQDKSMQAYHDIYYKEFQTPFNEQKKIEPTDAIQQIEYAFGGPEPYLTRKVHSPEALERIAHRVKPAPVLAISLKKIDEIYSNAGFFSLRHNQSRMTQLQQYFADEKHTNTLRPIDCLKKLFEELNDQRINPEGEYAKILSVLMMAINVSYKNHGNTLDWLKECDDQLAKTPLCVPAIKNLIFSYVDPVYLSWKDSTQENGAEQLRM